MKFYSAPYRCIIWDSLAASCRNWPWLTWQSWKGGAEAWASQMMQVAGIPGWFPQRAAIGRIPLRGESPIGPNYTLCPPLCQVREGPLEETLGLEVYGSPKEEQSAVTQSAANRCRTSQPMAGCKGRWQPRRVWAPCVSESQSCYKHPCAEPSGPYVFSGVRHALFWSLNLRRTNFVT